MRWANELKGILENYKFMLGQKVKLDKSTLFFSSNSSIRDRELISRALRAKYYPNTDFMQAKLGNYPLYTWRSIWETRKVLQDGMAWRVGSSENISIWQDVWVLRLENQRVQESASDYSVTKVADLIGLNLRQWKEEVITRLFSNKEAEAILDIPLAKDP
ncbi:hypothetical protein PVK06_002213 [Gossypium arboreum]|uniref:Reverse transcriptase n=1 Tax=Gossypium arboreum TaxID=29729 RepID=A0ABR0R469_GOSAR|nr:hypothetical protein PVK06_002213 [Gossypium arboreum]